MGLTAKERTRFARHLLLPEIGLAGQERLVATCVELKTGAEPRASSVAEVYLRRAGVQVGVAGEGTSKQVVEVADAETTERFAGHPALVPAASAVLGALSAVEAIKEVLQIGNRGDIALADLSLSPEDV